MSRQRSVAKSGNEAYSDTNYFEAIEGDGFGDSEEDGSRCGCYKKPLQAEVLVLDDSGPKPGMVKYE
jgi:hypothetical protein